VALSAATNVSVNTKNLRMGILSVQGSVKE